MNEEDMHSKYIQLISSYSKYKYGDALLELMDYYHVSSLRELTTEQLQEYYVLRYGDKTFHILNSK